MKNSVPMIPSENMGELLLFQTDGQGPQLEVRLYNENVWLSLNQLAELLQVDKSGISRHLKNIFTSGELQRDSVVAVFATTAADGKTYQVEYFNLNAIISVGYRVNSLRGTQRDWMERLHQFLTMTGREVLAHAGQISHEAAMHKAHAEYDKFCAVRAQLPTAVEQHFVEAEKRVQQNIPRRDRNKS